jgi:hypothetical protein
MQHLLRPYVTAGIAVVGASLIGYFQRYHRYATSKSPKFS